ncbi:MAG: hypothetical protein KGL39_11360 [Patescibacteria group bacterium]|nr:hypothetical protein [Patescibacteria group bacterium]
MGPNAGFKNRLMRAIHAEGKKRGIDHDGLHDLCRENYGVKSMSELSGEQLYGWYHGWTKKGLRSRTKVRPWGGADDCRLVGGEQLIELAQEFAKRGWGQQTQNNFIRRQLKGRDIIRTEHDWRIVIRGVRAMNRRDAEKQDGPKSTESAR